jgi:hypothetical protein
VVLWSAPGILREHDGDVRPWEVGHLIVPEKLPNKGCGVPRSAEEVEGRGLAKGNLVQQNRVRTQWREALRRALGWIRQAVSACASEPEVGAQCGSSACWDLCGSAG